MSLFVVDFQPGKQTMLFSPVHVTISHISGLHQESFFQVLKFIKAHGNENKGIFLLNTLQMVFCGLTS